MKMFLILLTEKLMAVIHWKVLCWRIPLLEVLDLVWDRTSSKDWPTGTRKLSFNECCGLISYDFFPGFPRSWFRPTVCFLIKKAIQEKSHQESVSVMSWFNLTIHFWLWSVWPKVRIVWLYWTTQPSTELPLIGWGSIRQVLLKSMNLSQPLWVFRQLLCVILLTWITILLVSLLSTILKKNQNIS